MKSIIKLVALFLFSTAALAEPTAPQPVVIDIIISCKSTTGVLVTWSDGHQQLINELPFTDEQKDILSRVPKGNLNTINVTPPGGCPIQV